jgi:hypothetical protein
VHAECADAPALDPIVVALPAPAAPARGGPMTRAVGASLAAVELGKADEGAAALCRRYAALIDDAAPAAKFRESIEAVTRALETLAVLDPVMGVDYVKHWGKITDALSAHSVASDLGPKLLAALTSLGLTLAGRGAKGGVVNGSATAGPARVESEFERLRRERDERTRQHGT